MFTLRKSFNFEASHILPEHKGKCARLHGHSYQVTLEIEGGSLGRSGPSKNMLIDFQDVSRVMRPVLEESLDHRHLNDTLDCDSPTAEFIARWIFDRVRNELQSLVAVTVHETRTGSVTYREPWRAASNVENGDAAKLVTAKRTNGQVVASSKQEVR